MEKGAELTERLRAMQPKLWFASRNSGFLHPAESGVVPIARVAPENGCPGWDRTSDQVINPGAPGLYAEPSKRSRMVREDFHDFISRSRAIAAERVG
jgi:hypothetical protein